jgi:hypothetical protein
MSTRRRHTISCIRESERWKKYHRKLFLPTVDYYEVAPPIWRGSQSAAREQPLPARSARASMAYASPHPQARQRSACDLARPLCRCSRRGDRRAVGSCEHGKNLGSGIAASTRAARTASTGMVAPRRFKARVQRSKRHGANICPSAPRPIFRRGAIKRPGPPRNIAALIGTSECRRIGAPLADRGRKRSCRRVLIAI